ncbi:retrotransposon protein, putative, ty1-copia subclass [Tanacetum coccineum]|uniref:Retrotransposon protein, putative, ty1-copia subclass n=1 Tax=Tanacetum coccineum TaxID=301880 RepID=A0ABQ5AU72_9ASTR
MTTCHHCKEVGHWKRNCLVYLAELLKKKKQVGSASSSGIFTIELFAFPNKSWVYDTGCGTNICITKQGFREARKLKQGALYLYVSNDVCAQVEAIRKMDFNPAFKDFGISVSKNNVHYFNVIPSNGIFEIDMHNLVPNVNSIYNVSTKKAKRNLDSSYLWHCRLAHISKKHIEKLQGRALKSTDDESFDQCVSFYQADEGKSFPHRPEREINLLGIIHTVVCGPLKHVSRQACGIVQQLTPPYAPQHNEVSEMRNRTFLDMVQSMMNLTTLPLSFWDYTLESATRILNMVPTKKGCKALVKRDTPHKLQQRSVKCIFIGYPKETMGYYFYFPPENKIVVARYAVFFEKNLITQEVSRRVIDLEEIQDEDTSPSEITRKIPMEVEGFEPPQKEVILVRRSERTHRAPDGLCLNVEAEEHSLGDLNEPTSYKAAM